VRLSRGVPLVVAALLTGAVAWPVPAAATTGADGHCARQEQLRVPGAAYERTACLPDLTTDDRQGQQLGRFLPRRHPAR